MEWSGTGGAFDVLRNQATKFSTVGSKLTARARSKYAEAHALLVSRASARAKRGRGRKNTYGVTR